MPISVRRLTRQLLQAAVVVLALCYPRHAAGQTEYTLVEMNGFTPAYDLNDAGTVVGFWNGPNGSRGYVWTQAAGAQPMITDPTLINRFPIYDYFPRRLAINANGVIAGQASANPDAFNVFRAAIYHGTLRVLGAPTEGDNSQAAHGINNLGMVVGRYYSNSQTGFVWTSASGLQVMPGDAVSGPGGDAHDVNDAGSVVGYASASQATGQLDAGFIWSAAEGLRLLPKVESAPSAVHQAMAINAGGVVVGRFVGAANGVFLWSAATGTIDLAAPPGIPEFVDVNDAGDVVATILLIQGGSVPYLFRNGTWTNINDLRPSGSTRTLTVVTAINNSGWMVGSSGTGQGWILIPPVNRPPVAFDGIAPVLAGAAVSGTLAASDPDNDPLTFAIVTSGTKGTAVVTDTSSGAYTYTANVGGDGTDTFTFRANDGQDNSNDATVTLTITSPPCAADITSTVAISGQTPKLNRKTGLYTQTVTLRNSDGAVSGPVSLVLVGLSSHATLVNRTGQTACSQPAGSPYIDVPVGADSQFISRERATITLEFTNPSGQAIVYTPRVLAGTSDR